MSSSATPAHVLARHYAWLHRGTFLGRRPDIASVAPAAVQLVDGYRRSSPVLPGCA